MKLLFENWRQYLIEVSFEDAMDILNSKRTMKIIKNYEYEHPQLRRGGTTTASRIADYHHKFKSEILNIIPHDLTDNQKGLSTLWLIKLSRENPSYAEDLIATGWRDHTIDFDLEKFFHNQRFMPQQDLMQIKTPDDLHHMVEDAQGDIEAHREKQLKSPEMIKEGTIFLRGGWYQPTTSLKGGLLQEEELETVPENGWVIMEIHNKAASCFHGTADWCTASPGLKYFEEYYEPEDPLFIFESKGDRRFLPGDKYQFHYGSEQFMDKKDRRVSDKLFKVLHDLLVQTGASEKYPIIKAYHYILMVDDPSTSPEELSEIAETLISGNPFGPYTSGGWSNEILAKVAKNSKTPLETLEKLAKFDNKYVRRSVQVNSTLDMGLAIELFVDNPNDVLIYERGSRDLVRFVGAGDITPQVYQQIIDKVNAERGYKPHAMPAEVANLERMHEHKFKIRITR
jgi:hypothetical protein